jgi:hypothetical protein
MRTTIDLPDALFREVKSTAAARGIKLKDLVISALQSAIHQPATDALDPRERHRRLMRDHFQRMDEGRAAHEPLGRFQRDSLQSLFSEDLQQSCTLQKLRVTNPFMEQNA